jgi:hypothetical protein
MAITGLGMLWVRFLPFLFSLCRFKSLRSYVDDQCRNDGEYLKIKYKGCVFVKVVNRETFNKMREAGLISDDKFTKSYVISSIHKKGKRKKIYVCEAIIKKYEQLIRSKSKKI